MEKSFKDDRQMKTQQYAGALYKLTMYSAKA